MVETNSTPGVVVTKPKSKFPVVLIVILVLLFLAFCCVGTFFAVFIVNRSSTVVSTNSYETIETPDYSLSYPSGYRRIVEENEDYAYGFGKMDLANGGGYYMFFWDDQTKSDLEMCTMTDDIITASYSLVLDVDQEKVHLLANDLLTKEGYEGCDIEVKVDDFEGVDVYLSSRYIRKSGSESAYLLSVSSPTNTGEKYQSLRNTLNLLKLK